jgi:shikimate kinase
VSQHLILIGLSGAGKTSVGARVAALLGTRFRDLDADIAAAAGRDITTMFREQGEVAFRDAERAAMTRALDDAPHVIAAGGGWAAQPGNLASAAGRAFVVLLACTPEAAAERLTGVVDRPLLQGDSAAALRALAAMRAPYYARADVAVQTVGRSVEEVAREVAALARSQGAW